MVDRSGTTARSIIGSLRTVRAGIDALVAKTDADELIIISGVTTMLRGCASSSSSPLSKEAPGMPRIGGQ